MDYTEYSHRYGLEIIKGNDQYKEVYLDFLNIIESISEKELAKLFDKRKDEGKKDTSLSKVVNQKIKEGLMQRQYWQKECHIFKNDEKNKGLKSWRLDFAYPNLFSVEVAFNHASAVTANLLKPVLASELNYVEKEFYTKFGIIVAVTSEFKTKGGFDNAIGTYEEFVTQCAPLMNQLTVPMIIIGLKSPKTFEIIHKKEGKRKVGYVKYY